MDRLRSRYEGGRIVVLGAAGTIGRSLVRELLTFSPRTLVLLDTNENDLALLTREIRELARERSTHLEALPIGLGTPELLDYTRREPACDVVFHLAGLKHVASENTSYGLRRLLDVNCLSGAEWLDLLPERARTTVCFASTDTRANPVSVMAASKLAFEGLLAVSGGPVVVARFSAVAFSQGSLLDVVRRRWQQGRHLSAPSGVTRAFLSRLEAAQLCILGAALATPGDLIVPRADRLAERPFDEVVRAMVRATGVEPLECGSDAEAAASMNGRVAGGPWPCCFHPTSETSAPSPSSLPYADAVEVEAPAPTLQAFRPQQSLASMRSAVEAFRAVLETGRLGGVTRAAYVQALATVVPGFTGQ